MLIDRWRLAVGKVFKRIRRIFDSKPIACHIYVTERCNLNCSYCTEYNNTLPHPPLETVKAWVDKVKDLGCIRIGLQGGEPLLHPNIAEIVHHIKSAGMSCSMSSNMLPLNEDLVAKLEEAGLDSIHASIDKVTPTEVTKKCLNSIKPKLDLLKNSKITLHMTSVLFKESLEELPQIFDYATSIGISVKAHLIHKGRTREFTTNPGDRARLENFINWEISEKKKGRDIRTTFNTLNFQKNILNGKDQKWTCLSGYKYFFISSQGKLMLCSMNKGPEIDILDVTPEILKKYNHKKPCQDSCGVYCVVTESLVNNNPVKFGLKEAKGHLF
jgi:MoaA/NifB/PqqE/SkfB family radical SAM enzyme